MKVVIVEDDKKIRQELKKLLEENGYEVSAINSFEEDIISELNRLEKDLLLLDIHLPNQNGFEICKKLKETENTPIIFVTSCTKEEEELKSILSGGDDFITKPYHKMILLEKMKRATKNHQIDKKEVTIKEVTLDFKMSTIKYQKKEVELTRNEFRILSYFFTHPDKIITKEELLDYLWNEKYYLDDNILTVNINRLRKKLADINQEQFIKTIRKKGYRI